MEYRVERAKVAAFVGWILIVVGLFGELKAGSRIVDLSASIQGCSDARVAEATLEANDAAESARIAHLEVDAVGIKVGKAETAAGIALGKSDKAGVEASNALDLASGARREADRAAISAGSAMSLAQGARQEADSFEKDIRDANTKAASAESHLADALRRATEATEELDRIRLPRSLVRETELTVKLGLFIGTEYTFSSVFQDDESIRFLRILDAELQGAGWRRVRPPHGFPAINVYGQDVDCAVPVGFGTGVSISDESRESISSLKALQVTKLPPPVQAAVALNKSLFWSISPSERIKLVPNVVVKNGDSTVVDIAIGKKM